MNRSDRPRRRKARPGSGWREAETPRHLAIRACLVRLVVMAALFSLCVSLLLVALLLFRYDREAARYDIRAVRWMPKESVVLEASGRLLGYLHGENVATELPLEEISPFFLKAVIAREDSRFYQHHGIDHWGLLRAWLRNIREKRTVQGGSTLTMQLSRMTYELEGRTMDRKLLEMAVARRIEKSCEKDEILGFYVNRVFLGTGMNGIEQAARGYFGKHASELSLSEAAMIAGVIRAPNGFSPFRHYDAALREMKSTLSRMEDEGMISPADAKAAASVKPVVLPQSRWMEMLKKEARISERTYLLSLVDEKIRELFPSHVGAGGLTIRTTFDSRLQAATEASIANRLNDLEQLPGYSHPRFSEYQGGVPSYLQAATTILENYTGAIRAVVGGRRFSHSEFDRAIRASRPMGSVFKPLVYGAAFERGLFPGMMVSDGKIEPGEISWSRRDWNPQNADGLFGGKLSVETGLIQSRNTMTVRVGEWAGIDTVIAMMEHAGLGKADSIERNPTIYLGSTGASVEDVTSAYSCFSTGGIRHEPYFIESVTDRDGTILFQHEDKNYRVLSLGAAWLTSHLLEKVVADGGTGAGLRQLGFTAPAGGKTGTTNRFEDAWFVGYTNRLSCGVWIGLDQPGTIMEGAYGGRIAVPIWYDIMSAAASIGYEFGDFPNPEGTVSMDLCRDCGLLPKRSCERAGSVYREVVPYDLIPRKSCRLH